MRALLLVTALFPLTALAAEPGSRTLVVGMDDSGRRAVLSEEAGEVPVRTLRITRGATVLCSAEVVVDDSVYVSALGDLTCDRWLDLRPAERNREAEREQADHDLPPARQYERKQLDPVAALRRHVHAVTDVANAAR